jgi:hypothetical protein
VKVESLEAREKECGYEVFTAQPLMWRSEKLALGPERSVTLPGAAYLNLNLGNRLFWILKLFAAFPREFSAGYPEKCL